MARLVRERPLLALLGAIGVVIAGRLVDLQWHLTHDEFEGASEQLRAHAVVWIGVLLVLTVSALAVRERIRGIGYRVALAGAALYVPVAVWHFIEHANGADPEVAHVLIVLADVVIITGGIAAIIERRNTASATAAGLRS